MTAFGPQQGPPVVPCLFCHIGGVPHQHPDGPPLLPCWSCWVGLCSECDPVTWFCVCLNCPTENRGPMNLWLPGAERIPNPHGLGLPMLGGGHFCTHHITVTGEGSYDGSKRALLNEGYEPTLLVDPVLGKIGQFLPGDRGGYALEHTTAETNTAGTIHIQIEWVWPDMQHDITKAKHFDECWQRVVHWCDELGIPREWPFGFHGTSRDVATWQRSGHRGHVNAPGNSHVDNLPALVQPAWPVEAKPATHKVAAEPAAKPVKKATKPAPAPWWRRFKW